MAPLYGIDVLAPKYWRKAPDLIISGPNPLVRAPVTIPDTAKPHSKLPSGVVLAGLIAINLLIGAIGGVVTSGSVTTWYRTLAKPAFNPPDFVFAPVWTTLYVVIAIAAWRIWRTHRPPGKTALRLYALQLVLNWLWSLAFFGLRNPGLALVDVIALLATAIVCLVYFARIDRLAALLWIPYLAWLSFATALNTAIVWLN